MPEHFISRSDAEKDLLSAAAFLAESINSSDGHAEAMAAVVPRYLAKGEVDLSAELANSVDDPFTRDKLLILVAEKCAELNDDEYAFQLIDSIEDLGLKSEGRERIGTIKANLGEIEAARRIADEASHPDFVYAAIASRLFADGDEQGFRETVEAIEFSEARVAAFVAVAQALLSSGGAAEFLDGALQDAIEIEHDEERIRNLIEIANLYCEAGRNGKAIETFDRAKEFAEDLDNVHRDAFLAAASIGFLRAGSQDLADRTLDLVADKTQIANCLLGHARLYWASGLGDDAVESLEEAYAILRSQKENETRSSPERFRLLAAISAQFAAFGKGERAIEIGENIEDENESVSALSQIASVLTYGSEDELARRAVNAIAEDGHRVFALIGMSEAKAKAGDSEGSLTLLDEALHLTETVPQLAMRSSAYQEMAARFHNLGRDGSARAAAELSFDTVLAIRDESSRAALLAQLSDIFVVLGSEIDVERGQNLRKLMVN